jgi:hypothetical protein
MSVKVPPVSIPIRNRAEADDWDMLVAAPWGLQRSMGRAGAPCQKLNIDAAIGKADGGGLGA